MRLWPAAFQTDRRCTQDFTIQPKNPKEKNLHLKKGTMVIIPILALHHNPEYFPNPKTFDPDRFNDENKSKIVPGTYLPFGIGPRNCIGNLKYFCYQFNWMNSFQVLEWLFWKLKLYVFTYC